MKRHKTACSRDQHFFMVSGVQFPDAMVLSKSAGPLHTSIEWTIWVAINLGCKQFQYFFMRSTAANQRRALLNTHSQSLLYKTLTSWRRTRGQKRKCSMHRSRWNRPLTPDERQVCITCKCGSCFRDLNRPSSRSKTANWAHKNQFLEGCNVATAWNGKKDCCLCSPWPDLSESVSNFLSYFFTVPLNPKPCHCCTSLTICSKTVHVYVSVYISPLQDTLRIK